MAGLCHGPGKPSPFSIEPQNAVEFSAICSHPLGERGGGGCPCPETEFRSRIRKKPRIYYIWDNVQYKELRSPESRE